MLSKGSVYHINCFLHINNIIPNFRTLRMPLYFVLSVFSLKFMSRDIFHKKVNNIIVSFILWFIVSNI